VSRARLRSLLVAIPLLAVGCASERPWKVDPEQQRHFDQSQDACQKLTDEPAGFERCMKRRGWRREWIFGL
jgi:hypothetical protein